VIDVGGFKIVSVYKPPSAHWDQDFPPALENPVLYVVDFNSHHPKWGYADSNTDGDTLLEWASENKLTLLHDAKQYGTFHSARWKKDSSPNLCWVSSSATHCQPAQQSVLQDFPHSQHRPVLTHIGLKLPIIHSSPRLRWNFRRADWALFSDTLGKSVVTIPSRSIPVDIAYRRFQGAIFKAATKSIPRGRRRSIHHAWRKSVRHCSRSVRSQETLTLRIT